MSAAFLLGLSAMAVAGAAFGAEETVAFDAGPLRTSFPAECRVDAGRAVSVACAELRSHPSRWYCSTPAKLTVAVADDPEGRVGRREIYRGDDLPPAFAGEALFVDWPAVTSRYWFFRFEEGGTRAIVRSGQYMNWAGFRIRSLWGWPNNRDGKFKDVIDLAALRLHAEIPAEAPQGSRPSAAAFDAPRLAKDWLMRDFGLDRWPEHLDTATNAAWLAANRACRADRLRRLARQASQVVYVRRKYALGGDDYHLYTLDLITRELKQITNSDHGRCADFEPCWTSADEIVFQSSRCEQVIPCHQTMAVNLYACRADGSGVHRLAADGGCTSHPTELPDGRILYTRYEYNDRSARLNQPLFTMNPDGTMQQEFYGNGSSFPTSLIHFRPIPGSGKLLGIVSGHHVHQQGKLVELDPSRGMEGDAGLTFVSGSDYEEKGVIVRSHYNGHPKMTPPRFPDSLDFASQTGQQWQYPHPLGTNGFLVSYLPEGTLAVKGSSGPHFGVYWQTRDGAPGVLRVVQGAHGRRTPDGPQLLVFLGRHLRAASAVRAGLVGLEADGLPRTVSSRRAGDGRREARHRLLARPWRSLRRILSRGDGLDRR